MYFNCIYIYMNIKTYHMYKKYIGTFVKVGK